MSTSGPARAPAEDRQRPPSAPVICVASHKGGVGKSTLAWNLAGPLGAILVDLDWDRGGVSYDWSPHPPRGTPLSDAFDAGRAALDAGREVRPPRVRHRAGFPDIVRSDPEVATLAIEEDEVADLLSAWCQAWGRPVIVDNHPGGGSALQRGAIGVADVVLVPVRMAVRDIRALEGMLDELAGVPILVVPYMVPRPEPLRLMRRLAEVTGAAQVPTAPLVHRYGWIERRLTRHRPLTMERSPGRAVQAAVDEFTAVAEEVTRWLSR